MVLAALHGVDKHYAGRTVLSGASLELRSLQRVALIGRNGSGKTTVLRLLMGDEQPDAGSSFRRDDAVFGLLEQDPTFAPQERIRDVAERAFGDLDAMEERLQALEADGLDDPETFEAWERLHDAFERRGGYQRRARRDAVLHALGFRGRDHDAAEQLSGGERTRLGLALLLMQQPDVLLLDEPTNHLDLEMRGWLESFLGRYPGAAVLVSHDRAFLDGACGHTAEVSRGALRTFDGTPTAYREARAEQERIESRTRANQRKEEARLEASAAQMRKWAGQNAKLMRRAKSIEKRLERHQEDMLPDAERPERTVRFTFPAARSGDLVLQARHLAKRYGEERLFGDVDLTVRSGERIALVGPNGAGKTTFLRLLVGEQPSDDPRALLDFGSKVRVGYYDQQLRGVDPQATLLEELVRLVGDRDAHDLLGRFLFPFDAQFKEVRDLSGGERARLALLKLTLGEHNLLILDEPTNHLDVEMIEALEASLAAFEGTLILVSHDRRFLEGLATRVWELRDGSFEDYEGDWSFYRRKQPERRGSSAEEAGEDDAGGTRASAGAGGPAAKAEQTDAAPGPRRGPSPWQLERERERLEGRVAELEEELSQLQRSLADPATHDGPALADLGRRHADVEEALLEAMAAWERTSEELAQRRARPRAG